MGGTFSVRTMTTESVRFEQLRLDVSVWVIRFNAALLHIPTSQRDQPPAFTALTLG